MVMINMIILIALLYKIYSPRVGVNRRSRRETERQRDRETERQRDRGTQRDREIERDFYFLKVHLGDSNRQPQSSRENLE